MLMGLDIVFFGVLGALIGSFGNVVIHRLPRRESVVKPRSRCPGCGTTLGPLDLVPVLSWLALRGRCRTCRAPISARYPLIEALTALVFVVIALRWPLEAYGVTLLPLLAVFAMLVMMSVIDVDHFVLPDSLTLPALAVALVGAFVYSPAAGLPGPYAAFFGAALGAGAIALVNRVGGLVLRRFSDTRERLWPIGMDQVNVAALGGALGGFAVGVGVAAASLAANLVTRRVLRLSEPLVYGAWFVALVAVGLFAWIDPLAALGGSVAATGVVAVLGAAFWWLRDIVRGNAPAEEEPADGDDEPIAMGFGDVKLAAVLGAFLGPQGILVAIFVAVFVGAIGGLILKAVSGSRQVPFGPYLAIGGLLSLLYGSDLVAWYVGLLGL